MPSRINSNYSQIINGQQDGPLPFGWKRTRLGDVAKKISIKKSPGDFPEMKYIGMDSIEPHTLKPHTIYRFGNLKSSGNYFEAGQVLYGRMRPYLNKVYKAEFEGTCSGEFIVLKCTNEIIPEFLQYLLHSKAFVKFANSKTSGDRPRISYEELSEYPVAIGPISDQRLLVSKIEELLSELDKSTEQLNITQQRLTTYRQAILKSAFEGRLTNSPKERQLPEGWNWRTIGDVSSSVAYGSAAKSKAIGKIPVLRMGNIQHGVFDWSDLVYTDDEGEIAKYALRKGDVLFNRTNSSELVGKTAIYKGERPAIFAGYLIRINRIEALIDADYLTYFLNSHFAKCYGDSVKTFGVNQSNINGAKLKTYPIPLAPLDEQQLIVQKIERCFSICDNLQQTIHESLHRSEIVRQTILRMAFNGTLLQNGFAGRRALPIEISQSPKVLPSHEHQTTGGQTLKVIRGITDTDMHAGILAMVIEAHEKSLKYHSKLTHVKGEKIAHLVESHIGIDLGRRPRKDAAGPDDFPHLKKVESRAAKAGWFGVKKLRIGQTYVSKSGMPKIVDRLKEVLPTTDLAKIEKLIQTFLPFELEHAEVIATLYAAWNNLLLDKKTPTDEEIVYEARENWSKRKLGIERKAFFKALTWMKGHGFVPEGKGKKVI